jgi:hypothetical protein
MYTNQVGLMLPGGRGHATVVQPVPRARPLATTTPGRVHAALEDRPEHRDDTGVVGRQGRRHAHVARAEGRITQRLDQDPVLR